MSHLARYTAKMAEIALKSEDKVNDAHPLTNSILTLSRAFAAQAATGVTLVNQGVRDTAEQTAQLSRLCRAWAEQRPAELEKAEKRAERIRDKEHEAFWDNHDRRTPGWSHISDYR